MKIEQELLAATGQKAKGKKEGDQDFLVRISTAVSELGDPEYEALSEQAQAWFTQAAAALNEEPAAPENIQAFEEFDEAEEAAAEEEEVEEEVAPEPEPKKKAALVKPTKKEPPKPEPKVAAPDKGKKAKADAAAVNAGTAAAKPTGPRSTSVADTIRYIMCEDPDATKEAVAKELKAKKLSFDPSRLDQVYSATARVLVILQELKKLK